MDSRETKKESLGSVGSLVGASIGSGNTRTKQMVYTPSKGFERNPLNNFPRNKACPCDSGKKWKKCCLKRISPVVTETAAKHIRLELGI